MKWTYSFAHALTEMAAHGATARLEGGPTLHISYDRRQRLLTADGAEWEPDQAALLSRKWVVSRVAHGAELPGGG